MHKQKESIFFKNAKKKIEEKSQIQITLKKMLLQ